MKILSSRWSAALLILALAAILAALGGLQYRSTQQISEATGRDMEESLQSALFDFRHALERELTALCQELSPGDGTAALNPKDVARRFSQWRQTSSHPALATEVLLWDSGSDREPIMISATGFYRPLPWPSALTGLPDELRTLYPNDTPSLAVASTSPLQAKTERFGRDSQFGWMIDEKRLVLVHPTSVRADRGATRTMWLVVPLDREFLSRHLLPDLARYRFGGHGDNYQVAVLTDGPNPVVLYSSQPGFGSSPESMVDARLNLFGPPFLVRGTSYSHAPGVIVPAMAESQGEGHLFIDPLEQSPARWALTVIAQHSKGSLEAAVTGLRQRNLAVNFGILGVLGLTLTMVIVTSQRARLLAQMQMDFVAGVSHELRTPLTAIILAARNLEDGVVRENGLARYGAAIKGQAAQLSELVDEILLFSETHSGRHIYKMEAVDVTLGIQTTMENLAPLIEASGFTVEENVSPDLPLVQADAAAFSQCLQNLVSNSLKYGGEKQWVGVRAFCSENGGKKEVCVTVEDRGLGIGPSELKQIFEPFYRSPEVASQIHGNGLGLPLTKSMVEAMGGRLTVTSELHKGSAFTIHLRPA
jgi:signal transduction histidine kinase